VTDIGEWLYEPDRAVIRAGLTGALVAAVDGAELATRRRLRLERHGARAALGAALPGRRGDAPVDQAPRSLAA
jgi:hypothetical protein